MSFRSQLCLFCLTLCLGTAQAQPDLPLVPPPPPSDPAFPGAFPGRTSSGLTLIKVNKVDVGKLTFTSEQLIYKKVPETRQREVQVGNRIVKQTYTVYKTVPVRTNRIISLKGIKVHDAAGFELKTEEVKKRLKPGITVTWSTNAKKTAAQYVKELKRDTLILVGASRPPTIPLPPKEGIFPRKDRLPPLKARPRIIRDILPRKERGIPKDR